MPLEDILRALEERAEKKIEQVKSEAEQRAREIKAEAEKEVSHTRSIRLKKLEGAVRSEATALIYSAKLRAKNITIEAQNEIVEEAFRIVGERLSRVHSDASYSRVFESLLDEALEFTDSSEVVVACRDDDRELASSLLEKRSISSGFAEPLNTLGGLRVSSGDGSIPVDNTLESRLERAKEKMRLEVANALFHD
ncbi:MAG: V-type ATP synthase subunit E [Actinomycetota bacterium]|nr:V-type ATP synthase subunit E [Actinomycetota bacterium]